jgi:hypothetical protein
MISVFRGRSVVERTLALRRTFRTLLRPGWGLLPSYLQDSNDRAEAGEQRHYQDIEDESFHRFATGKSKDIETAKASISLLYCQNCDISRDLLD